MTPAESSTKGGAAELIIAIEKPTVMSVGTQAEAAAGGTLTAATQTEMEAQWLS